LKFVQINAMSEARIFGSRPILVQVCNKCHFSPLAASLATVAAYVFDLADSGKKPTTINR